jgi:hypothetical protein
MKQIAMAVALLGLASVALAGDGPRAPVRIYDCPTSDAVSDVAISPDERYLAEALVAQESPAEVAEPRVVESIRMLDFRKECPVSDSKGERENAGGKATNNGPRIYGLRFTGDGRMVVFSDGVSLRVLRTDPLSELWNLKIPMRDHLGWFTDVAVARDAHVAVVLARPVRRRTPNEGPRLVRRPEFQQLFRAYDLDSGAVRSEVELPRELVAVGLALSPDGSHAAITVASEQVSEFSKTPDLIVIDVAKGAIVGQFRVHSFGQIAFADNQTVYTLGPTGNGYRRKFKLVDINTGQVIREIAEPKDRTLAGLSASADGRYIGSSLWRSEFSILAEVREGGDFGPDEFYMWNGASGELVARVKTAHSGALKLSPTGRFLLSGTRIFEFQLGESQSGPQSIAGSR